MLRLCGQTKRNRANHSYPERKALRHCRGPRNAQDRSACLLKPGSCIRNRPRVRSSGDRQSPWHCQLRSAAFERLPSRLVPASSCRDRVEGVVRSDAGVAHRLPLSARVVSTMPVQVKAKAPQISCWRQHGSPVLYGFFAKAGEVPSGIAAMIFVASRACATNPARCRFEHGLARAPQAIPGRAGPHTGRER